MFTASVVTYAADPVWGERYHLAVLVWAGDPLRVLVRRQALEETPIEILVRRHAPDARTMGRQVHVDHVERKLQELRALTLTGVHAWLGRQGLGIEEGDLRPIGPFTREEAVAVARGMLPRDLEVQIP